MSVPVLATVRDVESGVLAQPRHGQLAPAFRFGPAAGSRLKKGLQFGIEFITAGETVRVVHAAVLRCTGWPRPGAQSEHQGQGHARGISPLPFAGILPRLPPRRNTSLGDRLLPLATLLRRR